MKIIKLDGTEVDIKTYSLILLKYRIASPALTHFTEKIEGMDGNLYLGSEYDNRIIAADFLYESVDLTDYYLLKTEFYRLFASRTPFYIVFNREPGKRWLVRLNSPFEPEKVNTKIGSFTVEFITDIPFAESVGTTLDPLTFDASVWQVGQGLITDELAFSHHENTFSIYNAGDIRIDPRKIPLNIIFIGQSNFLSIRNITTGDNWQYFNQTNSTDILSLNGVRSLKNGVSIFSETNHKLVSIAPGWNHFELSGTSGEFEIKFNYRFYYL